MGRCNKVKSEPQRREKKRNQGVKIAEKFPEMLKAIKPQFHKAQYS